MDCLIDYIGLKDCGTTPASGLFINSLPGMSTELADKIANSEQGNFVEVWNDVQTRSFLRLQNDIVNVIHDQAVLEQVLFQTKKPRVYLNQPLIPAATTFRGVYVQVPESKYVVFYLKEIYVYSDTVVTTTVKVYDLNDGLEIHTQEVNLVVGLNTISVDKPFSNRFGTVDLYIGIDATGFSSIPFYPEFYNFYDCSNHCVNRVGDHSYLIIDPANLPLTGLPDIDRLTKFPDGQGIAIGAEILCSAEEFICQNKRNLQQSLLYLLGSEMLFQKLGSPRLNFFSSSNLEGTNALRVEFENRYMSNLKRTVRSLPMDSLCFDCGPVAQIAYKYNDV